MNREDASDAVVREASGDDLASILAMLVDDVRGAQRERVDDPLPTSYREAHDTISADPNNQLYVVDVDAKAVAVLQLTTIPGLTYQGGWRAQIEGVRVARACRGSGLGRLLIQSVIDIARDRGCCLVQLTTEKARDQALGFYESVGFTATHEGMKLHLV